MQKFILADPPFILVAQPWVHAGKRSTVTLHCQICTEDSSSDGSSSQSGWGKDRVRTRRPNKRSRKPIFLINSCVLESLLYVWTRECVISLVANPLTRERVFHPPIIVYLPANVCWLLQRPLADGMKASSRTRVRDHVTVIVWRLAHLERGQCRPSAYGRSNTVLMTMGIRVEQRRPWKKKEVMYLQCLYYFENEKSITWLNFTHASRLDQLLYYRRSIRDSIRSAYSWRHGIY